MTLCLGLRRVSRVSKVDTSIGVLCSQQAPMRLMKIFIIHQLNLHFYIKLNIGLMRIVHVAEMQMLRWACENKRV